MKTKTKPKPAQMPEDNTPRRNSRAGYCAACQIWCDKGTAEQVTIINPKFVYDTDKFIIDVIRCAERDACAQREAALLELCKPIVEAAKKKKEARRAAKIASWQKGCAADLAEFDRLVAAHDLREVPDGVFRPRCGAPSTSLLYSAEGGAVYDRAHVHGAQGPRGVVATDRRDGGEERCWASAHLVAEVVREKQREEAEKEARYQKEYAKEKRSYDKRDKAMAKWGENWRDHWPIEKGASRTKKAKVAPVAAAAKIVKEKKKPEKVVPIAKSAKVSTTQKRVHDDFIAHLKALKQAGPLSKTELLARLAVNTHSLQRGAVHEAGHALVGHSCGDKILSIQVYKRRNNAMIGGFVVGEPAAPDCLISRVATLLAGYIADCEYLQRAVSRGDRWNDAIDWSEEGEWKDRTTRAFFKLYREQSRTDWSKVCLALADLPAQKRFPTLLTAMRLARRLLRDHWGVVVDLAAKLTVVSRLSRSAFLRIVQTHQIQQVQQAA